MGGHLALVGDSLFEEAVDSAVVKSALGRPTPQVSCSFLLMYNLGGGR